MRTKYLLEVSIIVGCILLSNVLTSCTRPIDATRAVMATKAWDVITPELAAVGLLGAQQIDEAMPALRAIEANLEGVRGSWMFLDSVNKIAVFITNAGKSTAGSPFYFVGVVDIQNSVLIPDPSVVWIDYGIDFSRIKTFEDLENALRSRGFVRMMPASLPLLVNTLRMAISYISALGSATVDLIVAPAVLISPENALPYCKHDIDCIGIQN